MTQADLRLDRRDFFRTTALGAAAAGIVAGGAPAPAAGAEPPAPAGRPRIGCTSWAFHTFQAGADPEPGLDILGSLGFEGTELIVLGREDLKTFWNDAGVDRLRKALERNRLAVSQFVLFQPVVEGLSSLDDAERERSLDAFEAGCRLAKRFDAPLVNIVAPWARELGEGQGYIPRLYELKDPKPGEKFHLNLAPGFDWDRIWGRWIQTVKACLERVKAHGRKLSIEHHTHTLVPDAGTFLLLWSEIRDPSLGYNMDAGWTLSQREYPPVAIHRMRDRLFNLHMRDIDGLMRTFVHSGDGVMDFKAIAEALKAIRFRGFLDLEQDKHPDRDMKESCARYIAILKECL